MSFVYLLPLEMQWASYKQMMSQKIVYEDSL